MCNIQINDHIVQAYQKEIEAIMTFNLLQLVCVGQALGLHDKRYLTKNEKTCKQTLENKKWIEIST